MIIFETDRLIVRQYTEDDKDNFFLLSGNEAVMLYIRPVSTKEASDNLLLEYITSYKNNPHRGRWAALEKATGRFVGSFAIIPIPDDPEKMQLGYSLTQENWGKGYATELTNAGLQYFFANDQLPEIYGITEIPNTASQKVLLKAGFQPFGTKMEGGKELLLFKVRKESLSPALK